MILLLLQAFRGWFRRPSFPLISIFIVATAVAVQVVILALGNGIIERAPSGANQANLFMIWSSLPEGELAYADYEDIKRESKMLADVFALTRVSKAAGLVERTRRDVACCAVSGNYLRALGLNAFSGRFIDEKDDLPGAAPVVIISTELQTALGITIGSHLKLNLVSFEVVGVLPPDFRHVDNLDTIDALIPISQASIFRSKASFSNRGIQWLSVGGVLRDDSSPNNLEHELTGLAKELTKQHPASNYGVLLGARDIRTYRYLRNPVARIVVSLRIVGWILFTLALITFTGITLVRTLLRRGDLGTMTALGAGPFRVAAPPLFELIGVVVLSTIAGVFGAQGLIVAMKQDSLLAQWIRTAEIQIDAASIARVAAVVAGYVVVLIVILVLWTHRISRTHLALMHSNANVRVALFALPVAGQLALSITLIALGLTAAGVLWSRSRTVYPFYSRGLVFMPLNLRELGKATSDTQSRVFLAQVLDQIRATPGVESVSAASSFVLSGTAWTNLIVDGIDPSASADHNFSLYTTIAGDWFRTNGVPLITGRGISIADIEHNAAVAVVDRAAATRFWPGQSVIGKTFRPWPESDELEIVGIVENLPVKGAAEFRPRVYLPLFRAPDRVLFVTIHTSIDSDGWRQQVGRSLAGLWPYDSPPPMWNVEDQIARTTTDLKSVVRIVFMLTALSLLVSCIGCYYVAAFVASAQTRNSAIRLALGATRRQVATEGLRRFAFPIAMGLVLGVVFAWRLGRAHLTIGSEELNASLVAVLVSTVSVLALACSGMLVAYHRSTRGIWSRFRERLM